MYVVFHKEEGQYVYQNSFSINYIIYILNYTLATMTSKFIFITIDIAFMMNYIIHSNLRFPTIYHHVVTHFLNFLFPNQYMNSLFIRDNWEVTFVAHDLI